VGDKEVDAVEIGFEPVSEPWSEYKLADGGHVRMRLTVQRIYQVLEEDGQPAKTPDGFRYLIVESQNQLVVQE
jgi:hypothetical protein